MLPLGGRCLRRVSYLLAQRRREIGIRIALGSTRTGIFRLLLREGIVVVLGRSTGKHKMLPRKERLLVRLVQ